MPSQYTRKLISLGPRALVIQIPTPWIRYYGLRKGDEVDLIVNGEVRIIPRVSQLAPNKEPSLR
jgi:phosphate uptake regulator